MVKRIEAPAEPGGVESLDAIAREAEAMQAGEQAQAQQQEQVQQQAQAGQAQQQTAAAAQEVLMVLTMVRGLGAKMAHAAGVLPMETTMAIWTDADLAAMAGPLSDIANRYGGSEIQKWMEQFGPYVMLIAATAMPAIATVQAVRAHKALDVPVREVPAGGASSG